MNGTIAQYVALTCYANAYLNGVKFSTFFPGHSTCQFCREVRFVARGRTLLGKPAEKEIAATPDGWFEALKAQCVRQLCLGHQAGNQPGFADRMLTGLVGGGGTWYMEAQHPGGRSQVWLSNWEVIAPQADDRRIWQVTYDRSPERAAILRPEDNLDDVTRRLLYALQTLHTFSERVGTTAFSACFSRAIEALSGGAFSGYHRNLAPPGVLSNQAEVLLDAAQSAWVFGGMGSWNDLGFQGEDQLVYERLSEQLYRALIAAICAGANSII